MAALKHVPTSLRRSFIAWLLERVYDELQALREDFDEHDAELSTEIGRWMYREGAWDLKRPRAKRKKTPSYRIHKNVWDNWYGYEGTRRVISFTNTPFATAEDNAKAWLKAKLEGK